MVSSIYIGGIYNNAFKIVYYYLYTEIKGVSVFEIIIYSLMFKLKFTTLFLLKHFSFLKKRFSLEQTVIHLSKLRIKLFKIYLLLLDLIKMSKFRTLKLAFPFNVALISVLIKHLIPL